MINKNTSFIAFIDSLLSFAPVLLAFLVPVFFLPITAEFFEFNKLALIAISTAIMLILWGLKIFFGKSVELIKSPLDFPTLLVAGVYLLSTIFSLNKTASLFGSYGRWFPSLFGILNLIIFYYVASSNLGSKKVIRFGVLGLLLASTINSVVAIFSYYNVYIGTMPYFRFPNFNFTGSATTTVILAILAIVLAFTVMVHENNMFAKYLYTTATAVNLFVMLLIGKPSGWVVLAAGIVGILFFTGVENVKRSKIFVLIVLGIFAGLVMSFYIPVTKEILVNPQYPREISLPIVESWVVSSGAVRDFPVLGTGPSTFYLNFPRYKSLALNSTNLWNARFDKPSSELFEILGSLGLVGTAIFIFFAYRVVKFVLANKAIRDETGITQALSVGTLVILAAFLFSYATVTTSFVFFLLLALLVARAATEPNIHIAERVGVSIVTIGSSVDSLMSSEASERNQNLFHYLLVVPFVGLALASGYFTYKNYMGEYYTRKAIISSQAGDGKSYQYLAQAVNSNPRISDYHNSYAATSMLIAINISQKGELNDEDKKTQQDLVSEAIRNVRITTEVLDPLNVTNWEIRGNIYRSLIGAAQDSDKWAIDAYTNAINLEPTSPSLRLTLGGVYFITNDYISAANQFGQAIRLNTSYANAYYNLAQALIKLERFDDAKKAYETALNLVQKDSEDYKLLVEEIAKLTSMSSAPDKTAQKPTIQELSKTGMEKDIPQEPLSNVGNQTPTLESTPSAR